MIPRSANGMIGSLMLGCVLLSTAHAADPLPAESRIVSATGAAAPTQQAFTIATAEDLQVTLTDLQIPAPLTSATIVLTQGDTVAGQATLSSPATSATFSITGAVGDYVLWVFGSPAATTSVGTFTACVAPKTSPSACISSASLAGNITANSSAKDVTVSTVRTQLTVTTQGNYQFNFGDLNFPVALNVPPSLALFQGSTQVQPLPIPNGTSIPLSPGPYTLFSVAQADQTVKSGAYAINIVNTTAPAGTAPLFSGTVPVGLTNQSSPFNNPTAQSLTLKVTDFGFPGALGSATALLTQGGTVVGQANAAGGAMTFAAPAGALQVWTYANPGSTPGTYEVDVLAGTTPLFTTAQAVSPTGSAYAYTFVTPAVTAGTSYQATAADLQFPSQLAGLSFAVAQQGAILKQSTSAATLTVTPPASAPVVFLVSAQAPASGSVSGNGLFDVNLQSSGASAQLLFDKTQSVSSGSALYDSQSLNLGVAAGFTATLTDLKIPAAFGNLALVVSQGTNILGKIYGGGSFNFNGSVGTYQLTFVASPGTTTATPPVQEQFGMYGVAVVFSPATITTFKSSASSAATNSTITLTWDTTNANSCTGSGGGWNGTGTSGSQSVVLAATTTYTLSCTGAGGATSQSVTVTATAAQSSGGGGGVMDLASVVALLGLWTAHFHRGRRSADR